MGNIRIQQQTELYETQPLLNLLGISQHQIILSDKPDIIIPNLNGKHIGIEVMECRPSAIDSKNKDNKAQANNLVNFACNEYRKLLLARGLYHTCAHVTFKSAAFHVDRSISRAQFAQNIIAEIDRHQKNDFYERNHRLLPQEVFLKMKCKGEFNYKYVASVRLRDISPHTTFVSPLYCYLVNCIRHEHILKAIQYKETKLASYKMRPENKEISEYWLLLNIPKEEECDFEYYKPANTIESSYDKIYLTQWNDIMCIKQ